MTTQKADGPGIKICEKMGLDPNTVRRIIIDLEAQHPIKMYIELCDMDDVISCNLEALCENAEVKILEKSHADSL